MYINLNKFCYLVLATMAITLCAILSGILLLTNYKLLNYIVLGLTYLFGCYCVKTSKKYELLNENRS